VVGETISPLAGSRADTVLFVMLGTLLMMIGVTLRIKPSTQPHSPIYATICSFVKLPSLARVSRFKTGTGGGFF